MRKLWQGIHTFFVPHEQNNFRARAVQLHTLAVYLLILVAITFVTSIGDEDNPVLGYATDITIERLHAQTNEQRIANGLAPLAYNQDLSAAAEMKATDMFARNYWAHYGPDGTTPWSFITNSGYEYEYAGENLAKNFMFSDGVVQAWMESPTHRENILRNEYTEIGYAIQNGVLNGEETTLVVQMFGTPLDTGFLSQEPAEPAPLQQQPLTDQVPANPESLPRDSIESQNQPIDQPAPATAGQQTGMAAPSVSWAKMIFNSQVLFIAFLAVAFILDLIVAIRLNIIHLNLGGKHLAHVVFLAFIISGLVIITQGRIL